MNRGSVIVFLLLQAQGNFICSRHLNKQHARTHAHALSLTENCSPDRKELVLNESCQVEQEEYLNGESNCQVKEKKKRQIARSMFHSALTLKCDQG